MFACTATLCPQAYGFVRAFCSDAPVSKKVEAFMLAMKAQGHGVKLCSDGMGADRHLFALKSLAEERGEAVPAFFSSKVRVPGRSSRHCCCNVFPDEQAYRLLGHNVLSTSNCGNPSLRLFGFGPVVADGFGIGYLIKVPHAGDNGRPFV
jgi:carnitine O-acetyltransferase